jgi:nitrite reductase/ring-hydroxylating ferredoxin subunit/uncharacterized membrane protein
MNRLSRRLDSIVEAIQSSRSLDAVGRTVAVWFAKVVRPGAVKDLFSGTWLGHPVHPVLTDLPIGAWTSAMALDFLGGVEAQAAADMLIGVGVLTALPTAVTGLSDLADVVEPDERSVGVAHAVGNVSAVTLYALSFAMRRRGRRGLGNALSLAGAGVATASAYLGGHLVYRQVVGPSRAIDGPLPEWTPALESHELIEGKPKRVAVGTAQVMLYRTDGRIYALANRCSHRGGPLHKGQVDEATVTCPWHLSMFNLEDGSILRGPATAPQPVYDVREREGKVEIRSHSSS